MGDEGPVPELEGKLADGTLAELTEADGIAIDLRYASANNFVGRDLYGSWKRLLLHRIAADKLRTAVRLLATRQPTWRLLVFDGLRPNRIQQMFWEIVRGTPQEIYVADPAIGSIHNFGLAVDLSLVDGEGRELDMGTGFDDFTPLAEPCREASFVAAGLLTMQQVANRAVLRQAMLGASFHALATEWWHYDALPPEEVRSRFSMIL